MVGLFSSWIWDVSSQGHGGFDPNPYDHVTSHGNSDAIAVELQLTESPDTRISNNRQRNDKRNNAYLSNKEEKMMQKGVNRQQ